MNDNIILILLCIVLPNELADVDSIIEITKFKKKTSHLN